MKIAHIYLEFPNAALDQTFSYLSGGFDLERGMRVYVPLRNKDVIGFVDSVEEITDLARYEEEAGYALKPVFGVLDEKPLINEEMYELAKWMAKDTVTPMIACLNAMLPKALRYQSKRANIRKEVYLHYEFTPEKLTEKQENILKEIQAGDVLRSLMNAKSTYTVKKLLECGAVSLVEKEKEAKVEASYPVEPDKELTADQKKVFDAISSGKPAEVFLLRGVTGSGKTEIYLQLAKKCVEQGKQVLILVPEISLTPQMTAHVFRRFGKKVAIYHSALNEQETYEQYRLAEKKEVDVVVGTRSAVFMPFTDLGLIVLDEEHDTSYKQDSSPRYHARDVAIKRAKTHGARVVLGSATPSLESYARALKGVYTLTELPKRIFGTLANSVLADMTRERRKGYQILSGELTRRMRDVLSKGEQVILLLNRRGYAPVLRCTECGHVIHCPHCDIPMCYHKEDRTLKCHICGTSMPSGQECSKCGNREFTAYGYGTEKLEEEVKKQFPGYSVARLDADTAMRKDARQEILTAFGEHRYDILVGTQMISKGLDYGDVTLVGILNADALLNRLDYRAVEMTFDLLVQASGRSGRRKEGCVVVQVMEADHYAISLAVKQDYLAFFRREMKFRKLGQYPPYTYFISFIAEDPDQDKAYDEAVFVKNWFREKGETGLLGPSDILKHQDYYRFRVLYRGKDLEKMKELTRELYQYRREHKDHIRLVIDINPIGLEE
ncbi:MAG: primosomal protein N' [Erysipelotrichales bacterium]|nr:primosomal protein N' [Erysipelotrichales bacterium]